MGLVNETYIKQKQMNILGNIKRKVKRFLKKEWEFINNLIKDLKQ